MKILVVDDEPLVPRLFDQRFRKEIRSGELQFFYADTGDAALALLAGEAAGVELILSDINMPGMSGLDLLEALGRHGFRQPVYMVSAYDGSEFETEAMAKGAAGFLAKPVRFEDLSRIIQTLGEPRGTNPG